MTNVRIVERISYSHKHCDVQVATLVGISAVKPITEKSIVAKTLVRADCVVTSSISVTSMAPIVALIDISAVEAVSVVSFVTGTIITVVNIRTSGVSITLVGAIESVGNTHKSGYRNIATFIGVSAIEAIAKVAFVAGTLVATNSVVA